MATYTPAAGQHAYRMLGPVVEIEGQWAPQMVVQEIHRGLGARLHRATLALRPDDGHVWRFDAIGDLLRPGARLRIYEPVEGQAAAQEMLLWPLFDGVFSGGVGEISGDRDEATFDAIDAMAFFDRRQPVMLMTGATTSEQLPVVFNPSGEGNRSATRESVGASSAYVFADHGGAQWTTAEAVEFLQAAAMPSGALNDADQAALTRVLGKQELVNLDVTGLSGLAALQRTLGRAGVVFTRVTVPVGQSCVTRWVFLREGVGRRRRIGLQQAGEVLNLGKSNILSGRIKREQQPGEFQGTVELPFVHPDIWPGDVIDGVDRRRLDFHLRRHHQAALPMIREVVLRFDDRFTTTVVFK